MDNSAPQTKMEQCLKCSPDIEELRGKLQPRVLLHHSYRKLAQVRDTLKARGWLKGSEDFPNEDFPMINIYAWNLGITFVTTRMGVDMTLWIVDQLASCGAEHIVKVGTFLSLHDDEVKPGDVYIPTTAVALPGPSRAYLGRGRSVVRPNGRLAGKLKSAYPSAQMGRVLTYPVIRTVTKHPQYNIGEWQQKCFGLEMECAAVFAIGEHTKARTAAILICNRKWNTIEQGQQGKVDRSQATLPWRYYENYDKAMEAALEALVRAEDE